MPKAKLIDLETLFQKLSQYLSVSGPSTAIDLCKVLKISQATFSRLVQKDKGSLLRIGLGRQVFYAVHRIGAWGKSEIPVTLIDEKDNHILAAILHPLSPKGFYLESRCTEVFTSRLYEGLPYLFEDLRPSGFLGRLVPRLYPDLKVPGDISLWTDDDCLSYLVHYGWDLIGNFILGEKSYDVYLKNRVSRSDIIPEVDREKTYPKIAELVLSKGIPGSSAGGEQPKFLSILDTQRELSPVLVKFSPPIADAISLRISDLLVCEHIAHTVLKKHGKISSQSKLIKSGERVFLEMQRFDRVPSWGRRGVLSLRALALEFGCLQSYWFETAQSLLRQKVIGQNSYEEILWLEVFGKLIANTDMHPGNISFFCEGEEILGLAPVYDMLPMLYAPQQNQLVFRTFDLVPPQFSELSVWRQALNAARDFWSEVQKHSEISEEFKVLTAENESKLALLSQLKTLSAI